MFQRTQEQPIQQHSGPGLPGQNLRAEAEPLNEARNVDTPEIETQTDLSHARDIQNDICDDMVIDSDHSDQSDTDEPDHYSQAMERLQQTQDRIAQPREDELGQQHPRKLGGQDSNNV